MTFNSVTAVSSLLATLCLPFSAWAADFVLPDYEHYTLKNGLNVYLMQQSEVPLIDVSVVIRAGAVEDTKAGLAQMTSGTLLLGTQSISKEDFEQQLDFIGAGIEEEASAEYTKVSVSLASKDVDTVLPLLHEAVTSPGFDPQEFAKFQTRYQAGLAQKQESPRSMAGVYFNALLYAGHEYANSEDGDSESVAGITLKDVQQFHQSWYKPDNAAVVVVGDFDKAKMKSRVQRLFGRWQGKAQKRRALSALPTPDKSRVLLVNKDDASESTFRIGGPGIAFNNPDYVGIQVINTILGGRFTSWLNDELRVNSGLTYGARSRFATRMLGGSFYISSFTRTETTIDALDLALKTYARLWEKGIDEDTLKSAKAYVKGQFPPDYETSEQLARLLSNMFVFGFDEQFINTFTDKVSALDKQKAADIVAQYFPKQALQFVVVGKAADIRESLRKYGEITERNITDSQIKL